MSQEKQVPIEDEPEPPKVEEVKKPDLQKENVNNEFEVG